MEEITIPEPDDLRSIWPASVDLNPTAICNLDCPMCWGPYHTIPDGLSTEQWSRVIDFFASRGTSRVVLTGGEPLVRSDIVDIARHARDAGLGVTLSTNTLLLRRKAAILGLIDRIGIPLDGANPEEHAIMRQGKGNTGQRSFHTSLDALRFIEEYHPEIFVSVRTVVSRLNADNVVAIGDLLRERKVTQWLLYQFTPVSIGADHEQDLSIDDQTFRGVVERLQGAHPDLPAFGYPSEDRPGRYVFVGPEGNIFGVGEDGQYNVAGNFLKTHDDVLLANAVRSVFSPEQNYLHTAPRTK